VHLRGKPAAVHALTFCGNGSIEDQDGAKVVDVDHGGTGDHAVAKRFEECVCVVAIEAVTRPQPKGRGARRGSMLMIRFSSR
jgi:hypothetical protein